jgi:hypothetical protein
MVIIALLLLVLVLKTQIILVIQIKLRFHATRRNWIDWSKLSHLFKNDPFKISEKKRRTEHRIRIYTLSEQGYRRLTSLLASEK